MGYLFWFVFGESLLDFWVVSCVANDRTAGNATQVHVKVELLRNHILSLNTRIANNMPDLTIWMLIYLRYLFYDVSKNKNILLVDSLLLHIVNYVRLVGYCLVMFQLCFPARWQCKGQICIYHPFMTTTFLELHTYMGADLGCWLWINIPVINRMTITQVKLPTSKYMSK